MSKILAYFIFLIPTLISGQYPFEKFKTLSYKSVDFKMKESNNSLEYSCAINSFFNDKSDLEIILKGDINKFNETHLQIRTNRNSKKYIEEIPTQGTNGLYIADFNGDGLEDLKIVCCYMGCGLASLNVRVIYFFQKKDKEFTKISFDDKMDENRLERDINNDGIFEIITMTLQGHKAHNYWLFNVYNYKNDNLVCVNDKINYPIMTQLLFRDNFKITTKISRQIMKKYELKTPEEIHIDKY
jgi:hypothetical protein